MAKKRKRKLEIGGYSMSSDPYLQGAATINSSLIALSGSMKEKQAAKQQALIAERNALGSRKQQDLEALDEFEPEGYPLDTYYKKGGTLPSGIKKLEGGKAKSLSSDGALIVGPKHEQGGVDINATDEVEGGEVIKDNKVFSNTLKYKNGKTYASIAESLMRKKGKLEEKVNSNNEISKNTAKRQIDILNKRENELFEDQESKKINPNITNKMDLGGVIRGTAPYIDNITNAILAANTPKVRQPSYIKPRKLSTTVNVNDDLNDINNTITASNRFIQGNTSDSTAARNAIAMNNLRGVSARGKLGIAKENQESNLRSQNAKYLTEVDAINARKTDDYNDDNTTRQGVIQSRISANASNLADDFIEARNFDEQKRYNTEELAALKSMYNSGVVNRADKTFNSMLTKLNGHSNPSQGTVDPAIIKQFNISPDFINGKTQKELDDFINTLKKRQFKLTSR